MDGCVFKCSLLYCCNLSELFGAFFALILFISARLIHLLILLMVNVVIDLVVLNWDPIKSTLIVR